MKRSPAKMLAVLLALAFLLSGCASRFERLEDVSSALYIAEVASSFPQTFMPWFSRDGVAPTISSMIYSTLLSYDDITDTYQPNLAAEWAYLDRQGQPLITADGRVDYARLEEEYSGKDTAFISVRFALNPQATWSDGQPVTVRDIVFTFDLATNQKRSNHAGALVWANDLMHKYDQNTGRLRRQGIYTYDTGANEAGYPVSEAEKDHVFYFEVSKVLGAITPLVSTILVLPEHIYGSLVSIEQPINNTDPSPELRHAYENPVGCGPYQLDRANTNSQEIVLTRRADYHLKAPDGGALYKVDVLKFVLFQEINVAIYALKKGHVDVLDASVSANYARLFEHEPGISLFSAPGIFAQTLVINLNPPPERTNAMREQLTNPLLRKAIALAIDQDTLIGYVLSGRGRKVPMGLVREGVLHNPRADLIQGPMEERLRQANEILDSLYPDKDDKGYRLSSGSRLSFQVLGSPGEQDLINYLQVLLQKIGVEVRYAPKGNSPENTYLYGGNFDMTLQGVSFTPANVDIMMNAHYCNLNRSSNYGRLKDEQLNARIASMRTTLNREYKYQLVQEIEELAAAHYYKLPLYCQDVLSAARTDRFTGWVVSPGVGAFNMDSLSRLTPSGQKGR